MTRPRQQPGRPSRFTAAEIERIRAVYAAVEAVLEERRKVRAELGLSKDEFSGYGSGRMGKKPRRQARPTAETIDWIATTPRTTA